MEQSLLPGAARLEHCALGASRLTGSNADCASLSLARIKALRDSGTLHVFPWAVKGSGGGFGLFEGLGVGFVSNFYFLGALYARFRTECPIAASPRLRVQTPGKPLSQSCSPKYIFLGLSAADMVWTC